MLVVYNTLSRSKEEFKPRHGKKVEMFVCGQTVYDDAHLGHAKNYINFDIVARWLRFSGFDLKYVQNITDIDDKIIKRAQEQGVDSIDLARKFEKRFMEDMEAIGVKENIDMYPRSHDYIDPVREQIQLLLDNEHAYILDQDVYYDVAKFKDYTKLSGMKLSELEKHRIEPREGKKNPYDFALWKGGKDGEPSWEIDLNVKGKKITLKGRPGWHIEDTAMTYAIFGKQYDLHGGAIELIFPHHSNEIAQAEAAFNVKPFVKYWMHSGIMLIKGEKMSKSLKNFVRIRELLKKYSAEALRLFVASAHYRKDIAYTEALVKNAESRLNYLYSSLSVFYNMQEYKFESDEKDTDQVVRLFKDEFKDAMDDDFNTPLALAKLVWIVDQLRTHAETHPSIDRDAKKRAMDAVLSYAKIFGILGNDTYKDKLPDEAAKMIKEREVLRKEKNFEEADIIRKNLETKFGIKLDDSEYGPIWYKKKAD